MSKQFHTPDTPDWFAVSLSRALHSLARSAHVALLPDICASLDEAAGRIYVHESCINDMQTLGLSADHFYIYSGYKAPVDVLLTVLTVPELEGTQKGRICRDINSYLSNILLVVKERGSNVTRLFMDPDMCNLLIGLARLL